MYQNSMKLTIVIKRSYDYPYIFFEITAKCHIRDSHSVGMHFSYSQYNISSCCTDESY